MTTPQDGPDVEWGVLVWAPDREPYVVGPEQDRDEAVRSLEKTRALFPGDVRHLACRRVSPWQRAGEPLPDLVAPRASAPERPSLVCLDEDEAAAAGEVECLNCEGFGRLAAQGDDVALADSVTCPECDGTGRVLAGDA